MFSHFKENLVAELRRQNLTQTELAKRTGINDAIISGWIKQGRLPAVRSIEKVAKALNIPVTDLTENKNRQSNQVIGNNNSNINQTNNDNLEILLHRISILEKEVEILKLKISQLNIK